MSRFYYKTRQLLQNEPFITKRGTTNETGNLTASANTLKFLTKFVFNTIRNMGRSCE